MILILLDQLCEIITVLNTAGHAHLSLSVLTLSVPETKTAECANSVDLDEVAHDEPPHLGLHCLPSSL